MQQSDWRNKKILNALDEKGFDLTSLALSVGLSPSTLRNVMRVKYPKAERLIASVIGVEPSVIWPSRYSRETDK